MNRVFLIAIFMCAAALAHARGSVTLHAVDKPAAEVFGALMAQTGKNFVYEAGLLDGLRVSVDADSRPLKQVLSEIFRDTDIEYKLKGRDVVLRRRQVPASRRVIEATRGATALTASPNELDELVVVSRLETPPVESAELGARKLTAADMRGVPVIMGEPDVAKALQMQAGVADGSEGLAGMYVHGGEADENLWLLDNVPIYQVNHFAGLFSAFNTEAIRYADFFKTSIPAKYDGRLSSVADVRTADGSPDEFGGSARFGLTSGAVCLGGPIGSRTTWMVAARRSWYDLLSAPLLAIANSSSESEKTRFRYAFTDLNAKLTHRFSDKAKAFVSVYAGRDVLKTGADESDDNGSSGWSDSDRYDFSRGNLVAQAGLYYRFSHRTGAEFTAAYTRYFSTMKRDEKSTEYTQGGSRTSHIVVDTDNDINDWIARADFDTRLSETARLRYGIKGTVHSFLPARTYRSYDIDDTSMATRDSTTHYRGGEANAYADADWTITPCLRVNAGLQASLFRVDSHTRYGLAPRVSACYRPAPGWAVKAAYTRTNQFVHQLCQSYLALPSDQWIPISGDFKPESADKVALGAVWQPENGAYAITAEAYYKSMHNLIDFRDEYYLLPPLAQWDARLTSGSGTAKGLDITLEKKSGRLTGHIAYSLAWADRTFPEKNGGRTYPARNDNRHTIKILLGWRISSKVRLNAAWTGHSGNRYTLMTQTWQGPQTGAGDNDSFGHASEVPLRAPLNSYRLPFYHRLDLSLDIQRRHGYWTISLFNAYCHMNTIAVGRDEDRYGREVFRKVKLLPIIPSISYTWLF